MEYILITAGGLILFGCGYLTKSLVDSVRRCKKYVEYQNMKDEQLYTPHGVEEL